ncbi:MAG: hypothetical protein JWQ07_5132 [Ramlibacter sp.]|nr:hypothetical protein [Ramlibacter sp.]
MSARVNAAGEETAGLIALLACHGQRRVGIGAEGEELLLAVEPVLEAPPLAAGGCNDQIQPALVEELHRLRPGFCALIDVLVSVIWG